MFRPFFDAPFSIGCDLLVIPQSLSRSAEITERAFTDVERRTVLETLLSKDSEFGTILLKRSSPARIRYILFVQDNLRATASDIRAIGQVVGTQLTDLTDVQTIVLPDFDTFDPSLDAIKSEEMFLQALHETAPGNYQVWFNGEGQRYYDLPSSLRPTSSFFLALAEALPTILRNPEIAKLRSSGEFYYELARQKFSEFLDFQADPVFYDTVYQTFAGGAVLSSYLPTLDPNTAEAQFLILCGQLIAYIDYRAFNKLHWNLYEDKRVLARANVTQTNWIRNLTLFKLGAEVSPSVRNALQYLEDPMSQLTMLSEDHRDQVWSNISQEEYQGQVSIFKLIEYFDDQLITCNNPQNKTALYSRILYHPSAQTLWQDKEDVQSANLEITGPEGLTANQLVDRCLNEKSTSLDLGNCGLEDFENIPTLFECSHLEQLILSNEWAIYEDGKWKKRKSNNRGKRNHLNKLPDSLKDLSNLKTLICGGDWNDEGSAWNRWDITHLGPLPEMPQLEYLNLSNNLLENVSGLEKLTRLKFLYLNNNQLNHLPDLSTLIHLKELNCSSNNIEDISPLSKLPIIETLDLHHNTIRDISPLEQLITGRGIEDAKWKVGIINIAQNPLQIPPMDIVILGRDAVLSYLHDIERRALYTNEDVKVVLVGNSGAGKSTLVKYLDEGRDMDQPHPPTHWMQEKVVKSKFPIRHLNGRCNIHIFDFGGHDFYHDTHQLFYSYNTLYIVLWEKETDQSNTREVDAATTGSIPVLTQDYPVKYWLESIKHHIREIKPDNFESETKRSRTYSNAVLLIQNKVGGSSDLKHQDNETLHNKYPFIYEFMNMSIKHPERNMQQFDAILTEILEQMAIIGAQFPLFYKIIKNEIAVYSGPPVLSELEFLEFCNRHLNKPITFDESRFLIDHLKQIGLILHSSEKVYINKKWIVDGIYDILGGLKAKQGEFDLPYVQQRMNIDEDNAGHITKIMIDLKLIFSHPFESKFIAPLYLPPIPTGTINLFLNNRNIPFRRFEYPGFIHKQVILSFFSLYGSLAANSSNGQEAGSFHYYWKDGLIIKDPSSQSLVMIKFNMGKADEEAHIDVFDLGDQKDQTFVKKVIEHLKQINKDYETEEMVTLDGKKFVSIEILTKNAAHGKLVFSEARKADQHTSRIEETDPFKLRDYRALLPDDVSIKGKKIVISYSRQNEEELNTLKRFLEPMKASGLIAEIWASNIEYTGNEWDTEIKHRFEKADIVLFLISDHFYNTPYIYTKEIPSIIDRYIANKSVRIVPIVLSPYDWERKEPHNLKKFSALPYKAMPVSSFNDPNTAWYSISLHIRRMIEEDLDPGKEDIFVRELQEIHEKQLAGKL